VEEQVNKADKLKKLDEMILDKMLEWMESDETNRLPELGNAINYVKSNNLVESAVNREDDPLEVRKRKVAEAQKRRGAIK
jgi:hypothetical protein